LASRVMIQPLISGALASWDCSIFMDGLGLPRERKPLKWQILLGLITSSPPLVSSWPCWHFNW
jgi:hypothetical protein